jgi:hypothetical protein
LDDDDASAIPGVEGWMMMMISLSAKKCRAQPAHVCQVAVVCFFFLAITYIHTRSLAPEFKPALLEIQFRTTQLRIFFTASRSS